MAEVDEFLAHYGIPGMKWGKRTAAPKAQRYAEKSRQKDIDLYGKNAAKRVDKRVLKGDTVTKARRQEVNRQINIQRAKTIGVASIIVASIFAPQIMNVSSRALNSAVLAKKAANAARFSANLLADSKGIAAYSTIRLSQNPVTGNWV